MLKTGRKEARLAAEPAALELGITTKTLYNYENYITDVPPEIIKKMSILYGQHQKFRARYCSELCPIGHMDAPKIRERDVAVSALTLLRAYREASKAISEKYVDICEDNLIEEHELPVLEEVCSKLLPLEDAIQSAKMLAEMYLPSIKQKTASARIAERRVSYTKRAASAAR